MCAGNVLVALSYPLFFLFFHPSLTFLLGLNVGWWPERVRAQELCERRGGRPGLPSLINLRFLWT